MMFVEQIGAAYDLIMFYTEEKEDFNHPEIHDEFGDQGVEMMFESGMCIKRVSMGGVRG
ncbi:MAG: hypothetical protein ACXQTY_06655 [Candidatus Methanogasteraceae archaeon]